MILIGLFFYGNQYLVEPVREEAKVLVETVEGQEALLATYPPNEDLLEEYEANYLETESYLPIGDQANMAIVTLEQAAKQANVEVISVSRVADHQVIENAPDNFMKNTYEVQMAGQSPADFREWLDRLMNEKRVWNITAFSYEKAGEENYVGTLNVELAYYSDNPVDSDESVEPEEAEETESFEE